MKTRLFAVLVVVTFGSAVCAKDAPMPPSVVDLESSYCLPVLQRHVEQLSAVMQSNQVQQSPMLSSMTRQALEHFESTRDRVQAYLSSRIPFLEPTALQSAQQRGIADYEAAAKQSASCRASTHTQSEFDECIKQSDAATRTQKCMSAKFLPY